MSLLSLENISKEYRNQKVLDNVSLRVEKGERVALVGPNGAGKSTLIKIALGMEEADKGNIILAKAAKIAYLSQDMMELRELNGETALHLEQIIRLEEKLKILEKQMEDISIQMDYEKYDQVLKKYSNTLNEYEAMDGYVIESVITKILLGLGIKKEVLSIPINNLSGGEKMRVLFARMLINEPDLIILDEPTNHLDIKAIEWLEKFLKKFSGGVLMVSHDRYFLDEASTRIAELNNGTLCERSCSYSKFVEEKNSMRNHYIWEQKGLELEIKKERKVIEELKSHRKITAFKSREKRLNSLIEQKKKTQEEFKSSNHLNMDNKPRIRFNNIDHVSKDIAWGKNLNKSFGNIAIIKDGNFHIGGGERVGIIGDNGCGKTTLLNILLGNDNDYEGVATLGNWVRYSYLGQDVEFKNEELTILEEIMSIKEFTEKDGRLHLSKFQFYGDEVNKQLKVLSGGERVRVYLAEILLCEPHCLIMDEPTNHLDLAARESIELALREYKGTVIAVSHDRYFLKNSIEKIMEICNGKVSTFYGNYDFYKSEKNKNSETVGEEKNEKAVSKINKNYSINKNNTMVTARVKEENYREIEEKIIELEYEMQKLEDNFNEKTNYECYEKYGDLKRKVDNLYEKLV